MRPDLTAFSYDTFLNDFLIPWAPILLLGVICYFMWRTLK